MRGTVCRIPRRNATLLGRRALTDGPTWAIFAGTLVLVLLAKKLAERVIILAAGAAGVLIQSFAT